MEGAQRSQRPLRFAVVLAAVLCLAVTTTILPVTSASAAAEQLTPVVGFGSNPGNLLMFEWIPADLPPNAPVVVVLHGCFAGAGLYDDETGWTKLAERWKVALVFPEQTVVNEPTKCFRWWDGGHNARGRGEALSVAQMVDWMEANRGTDPERVFVMGHSGGGLFTSVMLATYPDVFRAGAIVAGGPYGCGDEGAIAVGIDGSKPPLRGGECVDGTVTHTSAEWGDRARSGNPGYAGPKPRVSIWHGTADTMVSPKNLAELVKQWTDYNGIDQAPEVVERVKGYPHKVYEDQAGDPRVESYELTGQSHGWPYDPGTAVDQCEGRTPSWDAGICGAYFAGLWFGLDQTGSPDDDPPTIEIRSPADGDTFVRGETVDADYVCSDERSGVESCDGPVASGERVDTSTVGEHVFTVAATDRARNSAVATHAYRVVYDTEAFLSPVDPPPEWNAANDHQAIPLKWRLRDASGATYKELSDEDVSFKWTKVDCGDRSTTGGPVDATSADGLEYKAGGDHYEWVARTPEDASGTCQRLTVTLDDGSTHVADFTFR